MKTQSMYKGRVCAIDRRERMIGGTGKGQTMRTTITAMGSDGSDEDGEVEEQKRTDECFIGTQDG